MFIIDDASTSIAAVMLTAIVGLAIALRVLGRRGYGNRIHRLERDALNNDRAYHHAIDGLERDNALLRNNDEANHHAIAGLEQALAANATRVDGLEQALEQALAANAL